MTITSRAKRSRIRGHRTHGWGSKKKRRGAGNRGGKGMAGTGKRGDQKKPLIWKNRKYFGKRGFKNHSRPDAVSINAGALSEKIAVLAQQGLAQEKSGTYDINLASLGYTKLLGAGNVKAKMNITVAKASPKAIKSVEAVGGSVTLTVSSEDNDSSEEMAGEAAEDDEPEKEKGANKAEESDDAEPEAEEKSG